MSRSRVQVGILVTALSVLVGCDKKPNTPCSDVLAITQLDQKAMHDPRVLAPTDASGSAGSTYRAAAVGLRADGAKLAAMSLAGADLTAARDKFVADVPATSKAMEDKAGVLDKLDAAQGRMTAAHANISAGQTRIRAACKGAPVPGGCAALETSANDLPYADVAQLATRAAAGRALSVDPALVPARDQLFQAVEQYAAAETDLQTLTQQAQRLDDPLIVLGVDGDRIAKACSGAK